MSENKETESQNALICQHLRNGNSITPMEALDLFGCLRLADRIHDIKGQGFHIESNWVYFNGKQYKEYFMPEAKPKKMTRFKWVKMWIKKPFNIAKVTKVFFLEA